MKSMTLKKLLRSKFFIIGAILSFIIIALSLISPYIIIHDPEIPDLPNRLKPPDFFTNGWSGNIFGTDPMGQDVLTRLLIGSRYSLAISLSAVFISAVVGIVLGLIAGYYGNWVDNLIMRFGDIQLSIPSMLLAITIVAILGPDLVNLVIVLIVTSWVQYARVIRGEVMKVRGMEFISASRVLGASDFWIITKQIFPNVLTPCIILGSQQIGFMILVEAAMSFLGLGVQPPKPSWGVMIANGRSYMQVAPWTVLVPGIALMITVLAFNFLGDGLRDAFDPKMKS